MRTIARFFILFLIFPVGITFADTQSTTPSTELTPTQVVHIVIDALKSNDSENNDDGIATVFEFASPGNKSVTGPLERFATMIKRGYGDMLNHVESEFGEIDIENNTALQAVWLTSSSGIKTGYVFQLGKQTSGKNAGMWMTESVLPLGTRKPEGQSI